MFILLCYTLGNLSSSYSISLEHCVFFLYSLRSVSSEMFDTDVSGRGMETRGVRPSRLRRSSFARCTRLPARFRPLLRCRDYLLFVELNLAEKPSSIFFQAFPASGAMTGQQSTQCASRFLRSATPRRLRTGEPPARPRPERLSRRRRVSPPGAGGAVPGPGLSARCSTPGPCLVCASSGVY